MTSNFLRRKDSPAHDMRSTRGKGFFTSDRRGNVAIMFAGAAFALMAGVGASIDYGRAVQAKSRAASVMDAAVLAAAIAIRDDTKSQSDDSAALALAKKTVANYWTSNIGAGSSTAYDVSVENNGTDLIVTAVYSDSIDTYFGQIVGLQKVPYGGTASSIAPGSPYIDVTLLVDTSSSMGLGATKADIDKLTAQFGCALACHDNPGADSYAWAESNGVTLRYDLIHSAITELADYFDSSNPGGRIRVQLYSFDNTMKKLVALTSDMRKIRSSLPSTPETSSEYDGATRFWEYGDTIPHLISKSGDGSNRGQALQLILMLTDGVQDPNRTWTWDTPLRKYVREFDWAPCDQVRADGAMIGVVQVPYYEMTWDWGYGVTLDEPSLLGNSGKRIDDVTMALKKCGGDLYLSAESPEEVISSFKALFLRARPIRISR